MPCDEETACRNVMACDTCVQKKHGACAVRAFWGFAHHGNSFCEGVAPIVPRSCAPQRTKGKAFCDTVTKGTLSQLFLRGDGARLCPAAHQGQLFFYKEMMQQCARNKSRPAPVLAASLNLRQINVWPPMLQQSATRDAALCEMCAAHV